MRQNYDKIYLGCSAYAIGACGADPENSLILEVGEGIAPEFTDALMTTGFARPEEPHAQAFYDELIERRIMTAESAAKGEVHLPAVAVVLIRLMKQHKVNVLFKTRVMAIEKGEGGIRVQAVCNAKLYEFTCKTLVDTRSNDFARIRQLDESARFYLCANMTMSELPEAAWEGMTLQKGFLPLEGYLKMAVDMPAVQDRKVFLDRFDARPRQFMKLRLMMLCHAYGVQSAFICQRAENETYIPGCGFGNPVDAYAAGWKDGGRNNG